MDRNGGAAFPWRVVLTGLKTSSVGTKKRTSRAIAGQSNTTDLRRSRGATVLCCIIVESSLPESTRFLGGAAHGYAQRIFSRAELFRATNLSSRSRVFALLYYLPSDKVQMNEEGHGGRHGMTTKHRKTRAKIGKELDRHSSVKP